MPTATYRRTKGRLEEYFDRTAAEAWARLTSDAPVSRIRETVRAGRDQMRATLLDWLPDDLSGQRVLDAGCGAGQLAIEAARRGADVLAIDIASAQIDLAEERTPADLGGGSVRFAVGDMLDPAHGAFDHVVAMDSLIHYDAADIASVLAGLAERTRQSILFTFAPYTPALAAMRAAGRLFPQDDRAPAIAPVREKTLRRFMGADPRLDEWRATTTARVSSGFYISQAMKARRL